MTQAYAPIWTDQRTGPTNKFGVGPVARADVKITEYKYKMPKRT